MNNTKKKLNLKLYDINPDINIVPNKSFIAILNNLKEWNPIFGLPKISEYFANGHVILL
jgi:hypothetical protein